MPGMLSFQTTDSLDQVASYYADHLKTDDWELSLTIEKSTAAVAQMWQRGKTYLTLTIG